MSIRAADGSINVTVVDGTTYTGVTASDGSANVIDDAGTNQGSHHPCGAFRVTVASSGEMGRAPDGSAYVSEDGSAGYKVTVVTGAFS
jgi:hypothetical protein